jgi:hypothetical protein
MTDSLTRQGGLRHGERESAGAFGPVARIVGGQCSRCRMALHRVNLTAL